MLVLRRAVKFSINAASVMVETMLTAVLIEAEAISKVTDKFDKLRSWREGALLATLVIRLISARLTRRVLAVAVMKASRLSDANDDALMPVRTTEASTK